ncbi:MULTISPECIES: PA3496 family putative envelope integrity protein [unclassified Marinobacterium]|uniref:PA3496 family putative envelope integrity protein n=1 Tax=unclassified Marinobacterium TaxID=2644139 RepID=UPI001568E4F3|nr:MULTISPECIES: hypothetical protein [unclassified Marinobacterium]NRP51783.1 hypothetical protein [Marinobacterium sp. xm-v-242]NRP76364.1 hypothetical protein [Marinobacterium sp. xm-m-383]
MGSKVRVDEKIEDLDDWNDQFEEQESQRNRSRYTAKRRRQIEDIMDDRVLASQLRDAYDELY